jgi:hypothetical protein
MSHIDQHGLEDWILDNGPHTFRDICIHFNVWQDAIGEGQVDRTLQKLRRAGKVEWVRSGRDIIWSVVTANDD